MMATSHAPPHTRITGALTHSAAAGDIAASIHAARAAGEAVRVTGAGTWLDAGAPVVAARTVSTARHAGIIEYVPGDLVLTALAGTTMHEIADATAANDQWLALDPHGSPEGTLGATVATASAGPLAHANGGPRDLVLGLECVTGEGEIIRGGGRVTKNVAGFDLTRLLVGSWGTLGIITEISVRLRARPAVETTLAMPMPADASELGARLAWIRTAPLEALAIELLDGRLAQRLELGSEPTLLVRLGGNADSLAAQRATVERGGDAREIAADIWDRLRVSEPAGAWTWRMSDLPSRIAGTWAHAAEIVSATGVGMMHASVGRGIVRCFCEPDGAAEADAFAASAFRGTTIFERLPAAVWPTLATPMATDAISCRIRAAFDPNGMLNPGILGAAAQ
jgi:glycolate oxidase FAD binding subunit